MAKPDIEKAIQENSILAWANSHRRIRTDGKWRDYNISEYPYLLKVFRSLQDPNTEQLTLQWATQTGKTEAILSSVFYYLVTQGENGLYMLPHASALNDFAHSRIDPILENSPWLERYFSDISNVRLKTSNRGGSLYLRGAAGSEAQLEEFPAGMTVFDEASRFKDQEKIDLALKRLGSTKNPWVVFLGHPLYEGCRLSSEFADSSRYEWAYKCPNCGEINVPINFFDNYYERDRTLGCRACSQDWSKSDVLQDGYWQAQGDPDNPNQGYHLSRMIAPTQDLDKMADAYEKAKSEGGTKLAVFHQTYLGEPFSASGDKISEKQVKNLMTGPSMATASGEGTILAADIGKPIYYSVIKGDNVLVVGKATNYDELHNVRERYKATTVALDSLPETHASRAFLDELPSRVRGWLIRTKGTGKIEGPKSNLEKNEITAHQTFMFDELFSRINKRQLTFPGDMPEEAVKHFTEPVRIVEDDTPKYQKGECHWADAVKFGLTAQEVTGQVPSPQEETVFDNLQHADIVEELPSLNKAIVVIHADYKGSGSFVLVGYNSDESRLYMGREWVRDQVSTFADVKLYEALKDWLTKLTVREGLRRKWSDGYLKPDWVYAPKTLAERIHQRRSDFFLRAAVNEFDSGDGLTKLLTLLEDDRVKIHKSCETLISELEDAKWKSTGSQVAMGDSTVLPAAANAIEVYMNWTSIREKLLDEVGAATETELDWSDYYNTE